MHIQSERHTVKLTLCLWRLGEICIEKESESLKENCLLYISMARPVISLLLSMWNVSKHSTGFSNTLFPVSPIVVTHRLSFQQAQFNLRGHTVQLQYVLHFDLRQDNPKKFKRWFRIEYYQLWSPYSKLSIKVEFEEKTYQHAKLVWHKPMPHFVLYNTV